MPQSQSPADAKRMGAGLPVRPPALRTPDISSLDQGGGRRLADTIPALDAGSRQAKRRRVEPPGVLAQALNLTLLVACNTMVIAPESWVDVAGTCAAYGAAAVPALAALEQQRQLEPRSFFRADSETDSEKGAWSAADCVRVGGFVLAGLWLVTNRRWISSLSSWLWGGGGGGKAKTS